MDVSLIRSDIAQGAEGVLHAEHDQGQQARRGAEHGRPDVESSLGRDTLKTSAYVGSGAPSGGTYS